MLCSGLPSGGEAEASRAEQSRAEQSSQVWLKDKRVTGGRLYWSDRLKDRDKGIEEEEERGQAANSWLDL